MSEQNSSTLHAYFGYRDAGGALRWLEKAFGFETTTEYADDRGGIAHAEMRYGVVAFIVFSDNLGYDRPVRKEDTVGQGMYIAVDSRETVDALYQRAVAAGAETVWEPELSEWNYRFRVADPEGFEWTFGIYRPGVPVEW